MTDDAAGGESAFGFYGSWREYAPIAFTNLLLTIVTLGVYRFWARTRTRRYLWSRTRFIDDRLHWTGTGLELFFGFLIAVVLLFVPLTLLNLVLQGVLMRGHPGWAAVIGVGLYLMVIYFLGVAVFRALRYRLGRTFWHGIRGGSDDQGFAFGWQYFWRTILGSLAFGLLIPWSMCTLWNRRWNAMSFGPMRFHAEAEWRNIFTRFLLFYFWPVIVFVGVMVVAGLIAGAGLIGGDGQPTSPAGIIVTGLLVIAVVLFLFYGLLGLIALAYYAAYFREGVSKLSLGGLQFDFTARTKDFLLLYLGNVGLTIATLGVGYIFVPYRNWVFFVRHAEAYGEVALDELTQSGTRDPRQGEGLLDALDVGAF